MARVFLSSQLTVPSDKGQAKLSMDGYGRARLAFMLPRSRYCSVQDRNRT